jgi:hypothetical protein
MKCKSRDCENEVEKDKAVCSSCIEKIFSSFVHAQSPEVVQKRREGVLEVVVRHALKDPDWRQKCASVIGYNQITEEEIKEAARLKGGKVKGMPAGTQDGWQKMASYQPFSSETWTISSDTEKKLVEISASLKQLSIDPETEVEVIKEQIAKMVEQLDKLLEMVKDDRQEREQLVKELS